MLPATSRCSRSIRITGCVVYAALLVRCASTPTPPVDSTPSDGVATVRVGQIEGVSGIVTLSLDDYVAGVVARELGGAWLRPANIQVARLQAVLARTYALSHVGRHRREGFDLCGTTHCQLFRPLGAIPASDAAVAREAARSTRALRILHQGQPIDAVYHADCGGHTSDASAVWGSIGAPYLRGVTDLMCPGPSREPWQFAVDAIALRDALNADPRTRVGARLNRVDIAETDEGGRALRVLLEGQHSPVVLADEFRRAVSQRFGPRSLRSTKFRITRKDGQFLFEGAGFGHGVGLCIAGAIAQLQAGRSLAAVISSYYPGAEVNALRGERRTPLVPLVSPKPSGYTQR